MNILYRIENFAKPAIICKLDIEKKAYDPVSWVVLLVISFSASLLFNPRPCGSLQNSPG